MWILKEKYDYLLKKYWLEKTDRATKTSLFDKLGDFIETKVKKSPTSPGLASSVGWSVKTFFIRIGQSLIQEPMKNCIKNLPLNYLKECWGTQHSLDVPLQRMLVNPTFPRCTKECWWTQHSRDVPLQRMLVNPTFPRCTFAKNAGEPNIPSDVPLQRMLVNPTFPRCTFTKNAGESNIPQMYLYKECWWTQHSPDVPLQRMLVNPTFPICTITKNAGEPNIP